MNEKLIERKLRDAVKQAGGLALKFTSPGFTGVPDRIILMPGRRAYFVETKSTGDKQSARQLIVSGLFKKLGFEVAVIDTQEKLNQFLIAIK